MALLRSVGLVLFFLSASYGLQRPVGDPLEAIQGLVARVLGQEYVSQFVYEVIQPDPVTGNDAFEIDAEETVGKPVLRGNNGVAFASALNFYLKYTCNCSVSWGRNGSGDQLNLPQPLLLPKLAQRMVSPVKYRCVGALSCRSKYLRFESLCFLAAGTTRTFALCPTRWHGGTSRGGRERSIGWP